MVQVATKPTKKEPQKNGDCNLTPPVGPSSAESQQPSTKLPRYDFQMRDQKGGNRTVTLQLIGPEEKGIRVFVDECAAGRIWFSSLWQLKSQGGYKDGGLKPTLDRIFGENRLPVINHVNEAIKQLDIEKACGLNHPNQRVNVFSSNPSKFVADSAEFFVQGKDEPTKTKISVRKIPEGIELGASTWKEGPLVVRYGDKEAYIEAVTRFIDDHVGNRGNRPNVLPEVEGIWDDLALSQGTSDDVWKKH
jgi:hypothetical protein